MPLALLEALAAGCPAIATAVGGVAEVLADGRTGLIVPPAAPGALAAAIRRCLVDPAWAAGLAAAGQAAVMDGFGTQAWARRWEALYLEHAQRDRSAPASARRAGPVESD
jgi:glycosyltransferase involved in cell wall biosynthesis